MVGIAAGIKYTPPPPFCIIDPFLSALTSSRRRLLDTALATRAPTAFLHGVIATLVNHPLQGGFVYFRSIRRTREK